MRVISVGVRKRRGLHCIVTAIGHFSNVMVLFFFVGGCTNENVKAILPSYVPLPPQIIASMHFQSRSLLFYPLYLLVAAP